LSTYHRVAPRDHQQFASDFRRRRLALGLQQVELGDLIGVPDTTISKWEKAGPANPILVNLALLYLEHIAMSGADFVTLYRERHLAFRGRIEGAPAAGAGLVLAQLAREIHVTEGGSE